MDGVFGVSLVDNLPTDMTRCRGVLGESDKASRKRGVFGVSGAATEGFEMVSGRQADVEALKQDIHFFRGLLAGNAAS